MDKRGLLHWCDSVESTLKPRTHVPEGEQPKQVPEQFLAAAIAYLREVAQTEGVPPTRLSWDWRGRPSLRKFQEALGPLGVHVYEDPLQGCDDEYAYVFSKTALNREELQACSAELWAHMTKR